MEKILILADFPAGAPFLRELAATCNDRALVISADERLFAPASVAPSSEIYAPAPSLAAPKRALASGLAHSNFCAYFAQPTAADLIAPFLSSELQIVYILLSDERSVRLAYDAVRARLATVPIAIVSNDAAYENDAFCSAFSPRAMVAARLVDELPSTPHIARFIGAGAGEIMQVKVPAGSIYANKHIHAITQRDYKIALIYRKGKPLLAGQARIILPGDELLLVGSPERLRKIFARVRATVGQFPQPYAGKIAVIIDMKIEKNIRKIINAALLMHARTNASECEIYVLNARAGEDLELLKSLRRSTISVQISFDITSADALISRLAVRSNYLFIASREGFFRSRAQYFAVHMSVLVLGERDFSALGKICALSQNGSGVEELSGVLLDLARLLNLRSEIYLYESENSEKNFAALCEHIEQQSVFFGTKLHLRRFERENPLLALSREKSTLCVAGFEREMAFSSAAQRYFGRFLNMNIAANFEQLRSNACLLVPIL